MSYLANLKTVSLQDAYPVFPLPAGVAVSPVKAMGVLLSITDWGGGGKRVSATITNSTSAPLPRICIALPLPAWPVESTSATRFGTIRADGWRQAAPCPERPMRAFYVRGGGTVLSILPRGSDRVLLNLWPGQQTMHLWIDRAVMPGAVEQVSVEIYERPADVLPASVTGLQPSYIGTAGVVAQANLDDQSNMGSYKDPFGVRLAKMLALKGTDVTALQCWGQQGSVPPAVSYSPDMLGVWAGTGVEMEDFSHLTRESSLRIGYTCRPGASIDAARTRGVIERVTDPEPFLAQLRTAIGWGVGELYCDSFGGHNGNVAGALAPAELTDRDISVGIRRELLAAGIGAPSMAELSTELTWDQLGLYVPCQWTGSGFSLAGVGWDGVKRGNISLELWRKLRQANPRLYAQAQVFAPDDKRPDAIDFCGSEGITPMVRWDQAPAFKAAIAAYQQKYVDPVTGFRK